MDTYEIDDDFEDQDDGQESPVMAGSNPVGFDNLQEQDALDVGDNDLLDDEEDPESNKRPLRVPQNQQKNPAKGPKNAYIIPQKDNESLVLEMDQDEKQKENFKTEDDRRGANADIAAPGYHNLANTGNIAEGYGRPLTKHQQRGRVSNSQGGVRKKMGQKLSHPFSGNKGNATSQEPMSQFGVGNNANSANQFMMHKPKQNL